MRKTARTFILLTASGLVFTLLAASFSNTLVNKTNAATETSADWNLPASATTSDYGSYYNGITGKQGMTLKDQLTDLIKDHTVVSYDGLYDLYKTSDNRPEDNTVFDMYGDFHFSHGKKCGSYSKEGDCFNREHSVPKSWFNKQSPMYSDAHHLYPTDGKVNGMRSNYAYGEVASASYTYSFQNQTPGITGTNKKGTSKRSLYNGTVFEPADCYKGDFARTYFYFATRYKEIMGTMSGNGTAHFTASTTYCNLTQYSKELFLDWHRADPVSKKEIIRNNAIYAKQKNRNPFIDHPEYVEAIWGDTPLGGGSISLSNSKLSMTYGGSAKQLIATSSDNSQITWTNSNPSVATLSSAASSSGSAVTVTPVSVGTTSITATATISGVNYSSTCTVVVSKEISTLTYTGTPDKTVYTEGESFDPKGLVVTATYTDSSHEDVTNNVSWTPNPLIEGTTSVTGTYLGLTVTINGLTVNHNDSSGTCSIDFTTNTQIVTSTQEKLQFANSPVTFTIEKYNGQTAANNYCPPKYSYTRAYTKNKVTISAGGSRIASISITCTSSSKANGYSGGYWTNATCEANDVEIIVTPTNPLLDVACVLSANVEMSSATIEVGDGSASTKVLEGISTTGQTETYQVGNIFSYDGVCTATYSDGTTKTVTPVVDSSDVNMSIPGVYTVGLEYTEESVTVSDCYDITVEAGEDTGFVNSIEQIYSKSLGDPVSNVYGLYVGSVNNGQSAIIMNGEYGILLHEKCENTWVENKTYIKVTTSKLNIFNSLYELKESVCEVITNTATINENIAPVVTYEITGVESTDNLTIANRLSLANGVVTNIENRSNSVYYNGWKDSSDNRITMNVNNHSISIFVKYNDAKSELGNKFKKSLNEESEITVQGFSSFYGSDFQVQFKTVVDPDTNYLAEDFAQDLLNLTNGACNNSFNNNWASVYSTLAPLWVTLEGADYYAKLPADQKLILKNTMADENGSALEEAMARYDHICLRYTSLTNFIGRTSAISHSNLANITKTPIGMSITIVIISGISFISVIAVAYILKKKRQ